MAVKRHLALALRLLWRDFRAGELHMLLAALVIAVGASSAISLFTDRLQRAMTEQSAELMGADLLLRAPRPVSEHWLMQAEQWGLQQQEALEFPSMVRFGEGLQLSGIKVVAAGYPLRGSLRISDEAYGAERAADGIPPSGEAWVEARLLALLGVAIGERITLGEIELQISQIVAFAPSGGDNFAALAPRLLVNRADLERAGILGAGSRVSYQYLFAGEPAALQRYQGWLKPQLEASHRLVDVREARPNVGAALERAERYLGLGSLAAVLLAGVAIAMAARRYSERHLDVSAMLRCLGAAQRDILMLYLPQWLLLGLLGSTLGLVVGALAQVGLFALLHELLLPVRLPSPGVAPALLSLLTGMVVLLGFALPPILRLREVSALRVLRRELSPLPLRAWLVYGLALAAMSLLITRHTGEPMLTLGVLFGASFALALLGLFAWFLLRLSRHLRQRVGMAWAYGLGQLWRRPLASVMQILAFGLTLTAMALVVLLRNDLLDSWLQQLPAQAPNHFVVNILPDELSRFADFLQAGQIDNSQLYPLVRGRLSGVNGRMLADVIKPGDNAGGALNRELNLTWSADLPIDNTLLSGTWWREEDRAQPLISLEAKLAERLGVGLGDVLHFNFGAGDELDVRVASLRTVQWDSLRPNFFVIFPPETLANFPSTWMTSFYASAAQAPLMAQMVREFPAVTVIDLGQILAQVRQIMGQVSLAVEYVLIFVLLAGFVVLYTALQTSLGERLHEGALLRTLGASRQQLRSAHLAEFAMLGLLAGLFALIATECIAWLLYVRVFNLPPALHWELGLLLPLGALLIGLAGYWGTRKVVQQSPLRVLQSL